MDMQGIDKFIYIVKTKKYNS